MSNPKNLSTDNNTKPVDEPKTHPFIYFTGWVAVLTGLYIISEYNYLLFHTIAELFSVIIACAIFIIAWNSRKLNPNNFLLIVGISFLFVAAIDFVHALAYRGLGVFGDIGANLATQLWIAARYLQSVSILAAALILYFNQRKRRLKAVLIFLGYAIAASLLFLAIFYWRVFPDAFIEDSGLTPFKKISEYAISAILLLAIFPLAKKEKEFDKPIFWLIIGSIAVMVLSEIAFTFYADPFGPANKAGHFLKIFAFYLIYWAAVVTNFKNPSSFLFKSLKEKEAQISDALKKSQEIAQSLKISERLYRDALIYTQSTLDTIRQPLIVVDENLKIDSANKSFYKFFRASSEEIEKKSLPKICDCEWDNPELIKLIRQTFAADKSFSDFEIEINCSKVGQKTLLFSGQKIKRPGSRPPLVLLGVEDITERKRAEKIIEHLASFPQLNPNPIIELDSGEKIIFANPAAKKILEDLRLKEDFHIFLPSDISQILEKMRQENSVKNFYREIRIKDRFFAVDIQLLKVKEIDAARVYATDITKRKKAEGSLQQANDYLEKLIAHANAPIMIWNAQKEITKFNHAFEQLTGYLENEIKGKKINLIFSKIQEDMIGRTPADEHWEATEIPIICKDGSPRTLLCSSANIYNNYYSENQSLLATIAQAQDITALKEVDRAKTEFISLAAHQLRTPLSTISLTTEILLAQSTDQIEPEDRQSLESIYQDTKNMAEIIDAFLNVSRIEMGTFPIDPKPANLIEAVDKIIEEMLPQIKNKRLELKKNYCAHNFKINIDQKIMRVTMENLVANAIKYTDEGGKISVAVIKSKDEAVIKVADTGWGIPEDQQNKIFEKMFRASNTKNAQADGVGLGLYTVKSILEQAGVNIRFESRLGQGTVFYIHIPLTGMEKKKK